MAERKTPGEKLQQALQEVDAVRNKTEWQKILDKIKAMFSKNVQEKKRSFWANTEKAVENKNENEVE